MKWLRKRIKGLIKKKRDEKVKERKERVKEMDERVNERNEWVREETKVIKETLGRFPAIFHKRKKGGANSFLLVYTPFQKGTKANLTKLLPLKVNQFP